MDGDPGLEMGSKACRIGNRAERGKPDICPTGEIAGRGWYKKQTAACNGTHSPSRFGALRKEADLYLVSNCEAQKNFMNKGEVNAGKTDCKLE